MIYVSIGSAVVLFVIALIWLRVVAVASRAVATALAAARSLSDPELHDDDKEKIMRKAAVSLLCGFFSILWRSLLALSVSALPMLIFDWTGVVGFDDTLSSLFTWQAICLSTAIAAMAYLAVRATK